jgi:hypothetical protein
MREQAVEKFIQVWDRAEKKIKRKQVESRAKGFFVMMKYSKNSNFSRQENVKTIAKLNNNCR